MRYLDTAKPHPLAKLVLSQLINSVVVGRNILLILVLLFFSVPRVASAASNCDLNLIYKDAVHYDPCTPVSSDGCSANATLSGSSNEEKTWNFLSGKGLTPIAVAGIMGNFVQEDSTFDPAEKQNGTTIAIPDKGDGKTGFGIAQWTSPPERQARLFTEIKNAGLEQYYGAGWGNPEVDKDIPADAIDKLLTIELNYAWRGDTTTIQSIADQLNAATTVKGNDGSAVLFHRLFERSNDDASKIQERVNSAVTMLQKYGSTGGSGSCSTGQLGGVNKMDDAVAWAMKFVKDTETEYKGSPYAVATLINDAGDSKIRSIAKWPESTSSQIVCWGASGCDECTTLSGWFVTKMTGYQYGGGNGGEVVANLKAKGVPTGSQPKPYSVFSYDTGSFGHTGVVLGVLADGSVITIENNWPSNTTSIRHYNIKADYPSATFAYVGDKLKAPVVN